MTYTTLLPARMGRLELRNRIVFPAMVTNYCSTRGEVTDRLVAYHQERAKGGAGLLITEATYISPDRISSVSMTMACCPALGVWWNPSTRRGPASPSSCAMPADRPPGP